MKPLLIIGTGDHALVVEDIARATDRAPIGFVSVHDGEALNDGAGAPLLGSLEGQMGWLAAHPEAEFVVAIGHNEARAEAFAAMQRLGLLPTRLIHPTAVLLGGATVGAGSQVCANAVIGVGASVERNVIVNTGATIDHHDRLADHVFVGPGAHIAGRVTIGEGANVGIGATIRQGISVGEWATVAAGAAVVDDVPPHARWAGVPARPMREPSEVAQ